MKEQPFIEVGWDESTNTTMIRIRDEHKIHWTLSTANIDSVESLSKQLKECAAHMRQNVRFS